MSEIDKAQLPDLLGPYLEAAAGCPLSEHMAWLESCVADAERVQPGMTRARLQRDFEPEGGISIVSERRFQHRSCSLVHLGIWFDLEVDLEEHSGDKIVRVGEPYLGGTVSD